MVSLDSRWVEILRERDRRHTEKRFPRDKDWRWRRKAERRNGGEKERERAIRVGSYTNKSGAECKDDNGCSSSLGLLTEPEKKKWPSPEEDNLLLLICLLMRH